MLIISDHTATQSIRPVVLPKDEKKSKVTNISSHIYDVQFIVKKVIR